MKQNAEMRSEEHSDINKIPETSRYLKGMHLHINFNDRVRKNLEA